jgi:uncharacterized protein (DUF697 family)
MAKRRIHAKGMVQQDEAIAAGTITPGMLLEIDSAGKVVVHNSEGAVAEKIFAVEDALQGRPVTTNYVATELVTYIMAVKGSSVNALLEAGATYALGDILISAGNGKLMRLADEASAVTTAMHVAIVTEALDLSASAAVDTLSEVRVL